MSKAKILFGSNIKPGPTVEVEDSLETIATSLKEEFSKGIHFLAVVETPNWKLIVDKSSLQTDGIFKLRPPQR